MADRKFTDWEWYDGNVHATVEVRYRFSDERLGLRATSRPVFYVKSAKPLVDAESGDLDALANMVNAQLSEFYALKWAPVLLVHLDTKLKPRTTSLQTVSPQVRVEPWWRAEGPDGDRWRRQGEMDVFKNRPNGVVVQDTPENRAKLEAASAEFQAAYAGAEAVLMAHVSGLASTTGDAS